LIEVSNGPGAINHWQTARPPRPRRDAKGYLRCLRLMFRAAAGVALGIFVAFLLLVPDHFNPALTPRN
jgi:hypothetical protein